MRTIAILYLLTGLILLYPSLALSFGIPVIVNIQEVEVFDEIDEPSGDADFYAVVTINGVKQQTDRCAFDDAGDKIFPNWEFFEEVDINQTNQVNVSIEIWDDDDPCPGSGGEATDDEQMDIDPGDGRTLSLVIDLNPCAVSGAISGSCNTVLTATGNDDEDDTGQIKFSIALGLDDPAGLHIYCLHDPIWPQPGDTVTINAMALGDKLLPRFVDEIQITTATSTPDVQAMDAAIASYTTDPINDPEFTYTCTALNDANNDSNIDSGDPNEVATSGFKTVAVGIPAGSDGVPILSSGSELNRHDIVLIPDMSYSGAMDAAFLKDVANIVDLYFRSGITFIDNQDNVNFWIAQTSGDAGGGFNAGNCPRTPPSNWPMSYTFANAGMILHRKDIRDCASMGIATAQMVRFDVDDNVIPFRPIVGFSPFVHELGHALFSLADEYCNTRQGGNPNGNCDGGYFQVNLLPNIFAGQSACDQDMANDPNAPAAADCQCFTSQNVKTLGQTFCTYDPPSGDLMNDNRLPKYLDNRRINDTFVNCRGC